jgi:hypothetical protein
MIKTWLRRKLNNILHDEEIMKKETSPVGSNSNSSVNGDAAMVFRVFNAVGGRVVEFNRPPRDHHNSNMVHRSEYTVYIIGEDEDFGARIAEISTMESLKR